MSNVLKSPSVTPSTSQLILSVRPLRYGIDHIIIRSIDLQRERLYRYLTLVHIVYHINRFSKLYLQPGWLTFVSISVLELVYYLKLMWMLIQQFLYSTHDFDRQVVNALPLSWKHRRPAAITSFPVTWLDSPWPICGGRETLTWELEHCSLSWRHLNFWLVLSLRHSTRHLTELLFMIQWNLWHNSSVNEWKYNKDLFLLNTWFAWLNLPRPLKACLTFEKKWITLSVQYYYWLRWKSEDRWKQFSHKTLGNRSHDIWLGVTNLTSHFWLWRHMTSWFANVWLECDNTHN